MYFNTIIFKIQALFTHKTMVEKQRNGSSVSQPSKVKNRPN